MQALTNNKKTGISYSPEVYEALRNYANKHTDGNISKAQNEINRKVFRFAVTDPNTKLVQKGLFEA